MRCIYSIKVFRNRSWLLRAHVLHGSSGESILQILEGKMNSKAAQERPRRMWLDDIMHWTKLNNYEDIKRTAEDRRKCRTSIRQLMMLMMALLRTAVS